MVEDWRSFKDSLIGTFAVLQDVKAQDYEDEQPRQWRRSGPAARLSEIQPVMAEKTASISQETSASSGAAVTLTVPCDLCDEPLLLLRVGQLVQACTLRSDGWAFGSIVYDDEVEHRSLSYSGCGCSTQAGWFPTERTGLPSNEQLRALFTALRGGPRDFGGEGAASALRPPSYWQVPRDPCVGECFTLADGAEKQRVVDFLLRSRSDDDRQGAMRIVDVLRVQNVGSWQTYAMRRRMTMLRELRELHERAETGGGERAAAATDGVTLRREAQPEGVHPYSNFPSFYPPDQMQEDADGFASHRYDRVWLFIPVKEQQSVQKVLRCGLNMEIDAAFIRNGCYTFGKGNYFDVDAAHATTRMRARPNAEGVQHIFMCRVTVGEYCVGKRISDLPDVRQGHGGRYDTTVNNVDRPLIFVTYRDAQAYPEYLVKFDCTRES